MTGRFARQQIKERNRRFRHKHWWRLAVLAAAIPALGLFIWLTVPNLEYPLWVVLPATCLCVLGAGWDQLAGTYHLACARDSEAWTSKELRKVCGPGWHVVDWISFAFHDVDHALVGPGGVYAIETKYTDSSIDLATSRGHEWAQGWVAQAVEGARSIRLLLRDVGVEQVYPGVIVWGSEVSGTPHFFEGVPLLRRKDLNLPWMPWRNDRKVLSPPEIDAIVGKLVEYRDMRVRYESGDHVSKAA